MKKTVGDIDSTSNWLAQIKAQYNVEHEDFTKHYPHGIIVYRGSSNPPNVVFKEGFKRSTDPIWIEDSAYLLKDRASVRHYVQKQLELNRTPIPDSEHRFILPPGANRGLVSTTFSSKKAAWYVSQSFLEKGKATALKLYGHIPDENIRINMCMAYLEGFFGRSAEVHEPIGYIYALRITQGINISAHFQWADFPDPDFIEQEIACLEIPGADVVYARPVFMNLVPNQGLACTPGELMQNPDISDVLLPLVNLSNDSETYLEVGFNHELDKYKSASNAGSIGFSRVAGEFVFTHRSDETLSLDEGNFSSFFIKPYIAKTRSEYLAKLKERLKDLEGAPNSAKRAKGNSEKISGQQYPLRVIDTFQMDDFDLNLHDSKQEPF